MDPATNHKLPLGDKPSGLATSAIRSLEMPTFHKPSIYRGIGNFRASQQEHTVKFHKALGLQ